MTDARQNSHVETNFITGQIVAAAMRVHSELGPGLLESVYRTCLCHELKKRGLRAVEETPVEIRYDGIVIKTILRIDIVVEDRVVVELKAVEQMKELYVSQILSCMNLSRIRTGLLINFNVRHLRHGIRRFVR